MTTWKPWPKHPDRYEVSDDGRVRSISRIVTMKNGRTKTVRQRELATHSDDTGRVAFTYTIDGKTRNGRLHQMVAETFIGPQPEGLVTCHRDGNPQNNRVSNLYYGTVQENMLDMVRHGRGNIGKTHCPQGHPYSGDNLRIIPKTGGRVCRICQIAHSRAFRERKALDGVD